MLLQDTGEGFFLLVYVMFFGLNYCMINGLEKFRANGVRLAFQMLSYQ